MSESKTTSESKSVLPQKLKGKALITGASGFIGGNLRTALLAAGVDVVAIVRPSSRTPRSGRSVVADYGDVAALTEVMRSEAPDWVFHVAGATKGVTYEDFQQANVLPTKNLLTALKAAHPGLSRFVLVSSLAAYGPSSPERPLRESDPRTPIEYYGRSKLEAEQVLESMGDSLPWTIIRPGGVYGPGDVDYFNLFKEVESRRNVFFGNKNRWFSAIYVDDCVRGIVGAALADSAKGKGYFLCDGRPLTWGEFQGAIVDASGHGAFTLNLPEFLVGLAAFGGELITKIDKKPRLFNRQKAKMSTCSAWTCSHKSALEDFGYIPEVDLAQGTRESMRWYRQEGWV